MNKYDLVVIGGGSGGVRAARIAATHGAKVAICEEYRYGGTCVIRGCVPKKMMVYAAHFHEDFEDSEHYGWRTQVQGFDWATLIGNKDKEIDRLNGIYITNLEKAGVEIFHSRAVLKDPHTVHIVDEVVMLDLQGDMARGARHPHRYAGVLVTRRPAWSQPAGSARPPVRSYRLG